MRLDQRVPPAVPRDSLSNGLVWMAYRDMTSWGRESLAFPTLDCEAVSRLSYPTVLTCASWSFPRELYLGYSGQQPRSDTPSLSNRPSQTSHPAPGKLAPQAYMHGLARACARLLLVMPCWHHGGCSKTRQLLVASLPDAGCREGGQDLSGPRQVVRLGRITGKTGCRCCNDDLLKYS